MSWNWDSQAHPVNRHIYFALQVFHTKSTYERCMQNKKRSRTHNVTVIGLGSLSYSGDNHLEVAGSIPTAGE